MKQTFQIIRLNFRAPLHLSRGKSEMDSASQLLHSDTIQSALASCAYLLFSDWKEAERRAFFHAFRVSSAFPYFNGHLFFPKPQAGLPPITEPGEENGRKEIDNREARKIKKRIRFIGQGYFEDLLNGRLSEIYREDIHLMHPENAESDYLLSRRFPTGTSLMESESVLRVSVARDQREEETEQQLYYLERLFFHEQAGLYFFLELSDESYRPALETALRLLADSGFGSDRNTGNGHFELNLERDWREISLDLPAQANRQVLLSLFCPAQLEGLDRLLDGSAYRLLRRGGFITNALDEDFLSYRKQSIYMFAEGSVLSGQPPQGKIVDLQPGIIKKAHPIWRDGRGLFLPMKTSGQHE